MRWLTISEEFGVYRVKTSTGASFVGRNLGRLLREASGPIPNGGDDIWEGADLLFETLVPPKPRTDEPVAA